MTLDTRLKESILSPVISRMCDCYCQLAEVNKRARIKLSEDVDKVTMPGRKDAYRLFGADGHALVDLLQQPDEPPVVQGTRVLCRHPFQVFLVPISLLLLVRLVVVSVSYLFYWCFEVLVFDSLRLLFNGIAKLLAYLCLTDHRLQTSFFQSCSVLICRLHLLPAVLES